MPVAELGVVFRPIAVETDVPGSLARETALVARLATITEIEDDHDVVTRPPAVPTVKGHDFVVRINVKDVHVRTAQPARVVVPIAAQANEIAVEIMNASERVVLTPIDAVGVAE